MHLNSTGDQSRRAFQVWRCVLQPGEWLHRQLCGETTGVRLKQDQRWHVHIQPLHPQQNPTEAHLYRERSLPIYGIR